MLMLRWETVVVGKKLVMLVPPLAAPIPADALTIAEQAAMFVGTPHAFLNDHFERLAPMLQIRGCILSPGDTIFIPCNHYHLTMNVGDAVAVGGTLDAASAAADVCPRDISALAASLVAPALPPTAEKPTPSALKRLTGLEVAARLAPFSLEAIIKYGAMLARTGNVVQAVNWFNESGTRYAALGKAGILAEAPLAAILEIFSEYCYGIWAAHGSDAHGSDGGHGSGGLRGVGIQKSKAENTAKIKQKKKKKKKKGKELAGARRGLLDGKDVALSLVKQAMALDPANPKAQATFLRILALCGKGSSNLDAARDLDSSSMKPADGAATTKSSPLDATVLDVGDSTAGRLWYQLKGTAVQLPPT